MRDQIKPAVNIFDIGTKSFFSDSFPSFFFMLLINVVLAGCEKSQDQANSDPDPLTVAGIKEVMPAHLADSIELNPVVSVAFKTYIDPLKVSTSTITLKKGSILVSGITTFSGTKAIFIPDDDLMPETEYTATVVTCRSAVSDDSETPKYSWKFKTGKHRLISSLSVVSAEPHVNATDVPVATWLTIIFNQDLTPPMQNSTCIVLIKDTSYVEGSLSFSGNTAIFKPKYNLSPNTVYSGKVKIGHVDTDEEDESVDYYYWSFTTVAVPVLLSFGSDVVPVLDLCNNCHPHPWNISADPSTYYTNLVDGGYINPSSPMESKIYTKLVGGHPGSGISTENKNKILTWVTEGLNNN